MFARPRPKKILHPSSSRKNRAPAVQEVNFDSNARTDFLTGFHKRKLLRAKKAKEEAARKARDERILEKKRLREQQRNELERHIGSVNALCKTPGSPNSANGISEISENGSWGGIQDDVSAEKFDHETEYCDEDRFTTVTVEEVSVSKEGLFKTEGQEDEDDEATAKEGGAVDSNMAQKRISKKVWPRKSKKFRYESKAERKASREKQKASKRARADARRRNA